MSDALFMKQAIGLAEKARDMGEVPVGAVVVKDGRVIATGFNCRESDKRITGHAEIIALENAAKALGDWRLDGCTLYVTLEPCLMCASAVEQSRISRIVYGSADTRAGAAGGKVDIFAYDFSLPVSITPFVLKKECDALLSRFFTSRRSEEADRS